ncbi:MAG: glycerol-3-phosphate 1-O-acyltransferase PlsY [Pyrinomonadaceae bacterium]
MRPLLTITLAYLIGSIPFGYLIVRFKQGSDVRESGSGGTGATNVSRRAGKRAGILTLFLDALKGAIAVLSAKYFLGSSTSEFLVIAAGIAVILGHIFPIWLRFRGGKGVATSIGVFLVLAPIAIVSAGLIFVLTVAFTRYISLGSILAAASLPVFILLQILFLSPPASVELIAAAVVTAVLIILAHKANIRRLIDGTESKFR